MRRHIRVVPAKAGTHTPRPMLLRKKDNDQRAKQLPPVVMGPGSRPGRRLMERRLSYANSSFHHPIDPTT
jgi:hypothetical protein